MSDTVVDSSVAAKWILAEADSAQADRLIAEVALKAAARIHACHAVNPALIL